MAGSGLPLSRKVTQKWTPDELRGRPKGDAAKAALAARLRAEATMTRGWIAERWLEMGTRGHLNHHSRSRDRSRVTTLAREC